MNVSERRMWSKPVIGWTLLDLANTIWSFAFATRYLSDWLLIERNEADWTLGAATFVASIFLIATLPYLGAVSDTRPVRVKLLGLFTFGCVISTVVIGTMSSLPVILGLVAFATYCYQATLAQYDPLLRHVAPHGKESTVSGIGVALGYFGVLMAIPVLSLIVGDGSSQRALIPAALMFGILAIPCLLWVSSPHPPDETVPKPKLKNTLSTTWKTVKEAKHAPWGRFLVARFFYTDSTITAVAVLSVFAQRVGGLNDKQVNIILAGSIVFAIIGAIIAGIVARKIGPKKVLVFAVILGIITMLLAAIGGATPLIWVCGPLCGLVLAIVNTTDRTLMLALVGDQPAGEAFGIYSLVGKLSAGLGPLVIWGGTIALFSGALGKPGASQLAVGGLAVTAAIGLFILWKVPDARPTDHVPEV